MNDELPSFESLCVDVDPAAQPALDRPGAAPADADQRQWIDEGVVVRRGFFPDEALDPYIAVRADLARFGPPALLSGWLNGNSYMHVPQLRRLSLHPPLMELLRHLLGEPAFLHLNLTNWMSSDRNWHQDSYLNPPEVGGWYAAVWIALGDIHPDSGPFQWISGSHRWPMLSGEKVRDTLPEADRDRRSESGAWIWPTLTQDMLAAVVDREIERRGAPVRTLLAEKGDLLVWHSRLMHRGSVAAVPFMERRSLIAHYSVIGRRPDMFAELDENGHGYFPLKDPLVWAVQVGSEITMCSQPYVEPSQP
jgi:ectoine hydroxylase-related dioxygenase (phytanoyl-CoA dioxygenase family)